MALATRLSFQESFLDYVTAAELAELDEMEKILSEKYREEGSWDFVAYNHRVWRQYLPEKIRSKHKNKGPKVYGGGHESLLRNHRQGKKPPPKDQTGLSKRLRLLDTTGHLLIGPPDSNGRTMERPIVLDGKTIGFLSLSYVPLPIAGIDERFREDHQNVIYYIAIASLLLAVIVGIPIGRRFIRPVKAITDGAHELAQGKFDTRIEVTGHDELGQLAHDFNGLAMALERNESLRRQGMADISHELRTPLALVRSEIEAMQDGIRPLNQQQLEKLHSSTQQLSSLVDDLYDLALTDAGALNYRKEDINLAEMLESAASSAEHSLSSSGLLFEVDISPNLPIFGDPKRLRQVIDNLLKNSRRYTDRHGTIQLTAWMEGSLVNFSIEDSAPGVDSDVLPRLFDRFYREEGSRNRATGGAGLGLSICRNIVEAHQGSITAEPSLLGGLKVTVSLSVEG
ncbi:ATP-binding protein [Neptuniibacter sp. QD48_55]|uniref:ATP-binding protein n=1 Tax=Neptuniibacter sp. QD48_55 TaxID=3398212 RepID=UPI0039F4E8A5